MNGTDLGREVRAFIRALFVLVEPVPPPQVATVTVRWDQPVAKERK
jgi:hypothetical protein